MGRDGGTKMSPDEVEELFHEYKAECINTEKTFIMDGFADYINVHQDTLTDWGKRPEFSDLIKKVKQYAKVDLLQGGLTNKYNPTMAIFLAKVNHGMQDKQVIEEKSERTGTTVINIVEDKKQS